MENLKNSANASNEVTLCRRLIENPILDNCKCVRIDPKNDDLLFIGIRRLYQLLVLEISTGTLSNFSDTQFFEINSIVFNQRGDIIIAERGNKKVKLIDREKKTIDEQMILSGFSDPTALAIDSRDVLYVADQIKIKVYQVGSDKRYAVHYVIPGFAWVYGLCLTPEENLCFFDYSNGSLGIIFDKEDEKKRLIKKVILETRRITDIACDHFGNVVGAEWNYSGLALKLNYYPHHEEDACHPFSADIIRADTKSVLEKAAAELAASTNSKLLPKSGTAEYKVDTFSRPTGVCFDRRQNLYVAESDGKRIWQVSARSVSGIEWAPFRELILSKADINSVLYVNTCGIIDIVNYIISHLVSVCLTTHKKPGPTTDKGITV